MLARKIIRLAADAFAEDEEPLFSSLWRGPPYPTHLEDIRDAEALETTSPGPRRAREKVGNRCRNNFEINRFFEILDEFGDFSDFSLPD